MRVASYWLVLKGRGRDVAFFEEAADDGEVDGIHPVALQVLPVAFDVLAKLPVLRPHHEPTATQLRVVHDRPPAGPAAGDAVRDTARALTQPLNVKPQNPERKRQSRLQFNAGRDAALGTLPFDV